MDGVLAAGRPAATSPNGSAAIDRPPGAAMLVALATTVSMVIAVTVFAAALVLLARGLAGAYTLAAWTTVPAATLAAAAVAAAGLTMRASIRPGSGSRRPTAGDTTVTPIAAPGGPSAAVHRPTSPTPAPLPAPWADGRLVQRLERYERTASDGGFAEAAVGRVVARFEEGARTAVVHVGFCPPFNAMPRVTVSTECDGLEVNLSAAEVLPWGVRIEGRLEEPAEAPVDVEVDLVAVPPGSV